MVFPITIDRFANPEALILLLFIPAYAIWYFRFFKDRRLLIKLSYDPEKLHRPKLDLTFLRFLPRVLQLAAVFLLIIALARPQKVDQIIEREAEGSAIMILLDVSNSMEATDLNPNRLEAAKSTAMAFIERRPYDQIGLIVFAGEAYVYAPLTVDHDYLLKMVRNITKGMLPVQGSAVGMAIALGINRLRDAQQRARLLVLLTDGANNRGEIDPVNAARLAADQGMRLYSVAIGEDDQANLDEGFALPDPGLLSQITQITGGESFSGPDQQKLYAAMDQISRMEPSEVEQVIIRQAEDIYPSFLMSGIIFLTLAFILMLTFMYNPLEQ